MGKDTLRQISVVVITIATIVMNILANALPLNGQNTGDISDRFPVYFVPAGYVFSIWGLIYIGLIAWAVYQALPAQRTNPRMRATGWWYVLANAANIVWLFFWHYNIFPLTIVAMLTLLVSLVMIYLGLHRNERGVSSAEKWAVHVPASLYLGWISVATIANASNVLYDLGWNGGPIAPEVWTVIMLAAATLIASAMLYLRRDVTYALVLVWAAVGIANRQAGVDLVPTAAWVVAGLVGLLAVVTLARGALRRTTAASA